MESNMMASEEHKTTLIGNHISLEDKILIENVEDDEEQSAQRKSQRINLINNIEN